MNRYWNLSPRERASLTREQVESFLDVELMEKGVVKIDPPILQDELSVKPQTNEYFEVFYKGQYSDTSSGFVFSTAEQAKAFIDAKPLEVESDYRHSVPWVQPCTEMSIKPRQLPNESQMLAVKANAKKLAAIQTANNKARAAYDTAVKTVKEAVQGVWDDWQGVREDNAKYRKVLDTLAKYTTLADGNVDIARHFLAKVYTETELSDALDWFKETDIDTPATA